METKRILVTGAAGFIGSNICLELQKQRHEVVAVDNFSNGTKENLQEFEGLIIEADIRNLKWQREKVDAVIHQGAITDTTVQDRDLMFEVNVESFKKLLGYVKKNSVDLIYASSAAVYGRSKIPMREGQEPELLSFYAESKWEADRIASEHFAAFEKKELRLIGLRYFNVYGPHEEHKKKMASMIWQLYLQMKSGKKPRIFKFGEQTRDQVYVKDVAAATLLALNAKKNGINGIYNIGSGKQTSFNKIIEELNKNLGTSFKPEYFDNPYLHYQEHTLADLSNARKFLGYESKWNIEKGISDYVKWLENEMINLKILKVKN